MGSPLLTIPNHNYSADEGAGPSFELVGVRWGTSSIADDISDEVRYHLDWPRVIRGREEPMRQFRGYVRSIRLPSADNLIVHRADGGRVVVIEYEVHGTILATGATYENRFCSIIELENWKIAHWRDDMDSHAAWTALGGSSA